MARFGALREDIVTVDGRDMSYAEWGESHGRTVVGWPGNPGSRFGLGWARQWAAELHVRLIIFDRPGMGLSTPEPTRTVSSTAASVCRAVASLGVETFAVLGLSSGGPYALACAAVAPVAVQRVAIVAGVGLMGEPNAHDGMSPENDDFWSRASTRPHATADDFARTLRDAPGRGLHPERLADIEEAGRQGAEHLAFDAYVITTAWGFDLADVVAPVDLWHGALDDDVPLDQARRLSNLLPRASLHVWTDAGHDMPPDAMPEVYRTLLAPTG